MKGRRRVVSRRRIGPFYLYSIELRALFEQMLWPNGPVCPRCGQSSSVQVVKKAGIWTGNYRCRSCRRTFNIEFATPFRRTHLGMGQWAEALRLWLNSNGHLDVMGVQEEIGVSKKTAKRILKTLPVIVDFLEERGIPRDRIFYFRSVMPYIRAIEHAGARCDKGVIKNREDYAHVR